MAAYRYWRLVVTRWRSNGVDGTSSHTRVSEMNFATSAGVVWPQAALTSASTPAPYVVTASGQDANFPAYRAFDGVAGDSNRWLSGDAVQSSTWLQIDMGQALDFDRFSLAPDAAVTIGGGYFPVDFEIWASATGTFTGEHVVRAQYTGVTSGWANSTLREFAFVVTSAYPISETFATGIPAGFANLTGTGMTAAYDTGNQAVQLVGSAALFPIWTITAAPTTGDFFAEFDLELVADTSGIQHLGIWLQTGSGYTGYRFAQQGGQPYNFKLSIFNAGGGEVSNWTVLSPERHQLGARKVWRADYIRAGGIGRMVFSMGGVPLIDCVDTTMGIVRPAVFAYGSTVRVHSVVANTGSAYPSVAPVGHALPIGLAHSSNGSQGNQAGAPSARGFGMNVLRRNHWFSGNGRVRGTVFEKGTPNAPVHRKVRLFHEASGVMVAEVWSDAITGAYIFDNLDASAQKYTVISFDHTGAFRAVVADGQIPEVMA